MGMGIVLMGMGIAYFVGEQEKAFLVYCVPKNNTGGNDFGSSMPPVLFLGTKYTKYAFSAGAPPRTPLGNLTGSPS